MENQQQNSPVLTKSATDVNNEITKIELPFTQALKKDLSFAGTMQQIVGVLTIMSGAMACLGIITAIFGVPVLISGIRLFNSGSNLSIVASTGDEKQLALGIANLASYWKWMLINFIIIAICFILMFALFGSLIAMMGSGY